MGDPFSMALTTTLQYRIRRLAHQCVHEQDHAVPVLLPLPVRFLLLIQPQVSLSRVQRLGMQPVMSFFHEMAIDLFLFCQSLLELFSARSQSLFVYNQLNF